MQINGRGISCPQPVMMAKKAVDENTKTIEILVDNGAPKTNVSRFLKNSGYKVQVEVDDDGAVIKAEK